MATTHREVSPIVKAELIRQLIADLDAIPDDRRPLAYAALRQLRNETVGRITADLALLDLVDQTLTAHHQTGDNS